jgi:sugar phosphate isomerase/epimerase
VLAATGPFYGYPLEATFAAAKDAGFDGVEVMVTTDRLTQDPDELNRLQARYELPILALHGPFLLLTKRVFGTDPRGKVAKSVELAAAVGAPVVITHAPFRWEVPYIDWLPGEIHRIRAERGITVTVENMFPIIVRGMKVGFHAGLELQRLRRFEFITLDTSHLAVAADFSLAEAWEQVGDQTVHLHVANNAGLGRDTHSPIEQGVLPVTRFLEDIGAQGWNGGVCLEINFRSLLDDPIMLVAAMRHELELTKRHLALGRERAEAART